MINKKMTRRDFLWLISVSMAATSCAKNPVTGENQFMLISEGKERQLDRNGYPQQFAADYGVINDSGLNKYLNEVGQGLASLSHRPQMPYSFHGVNAIYVNAYAFPAGTIAMTRGILLSLRSEAELAALIGHEVGHVNARHTGERMSKKMLMASIVMLGTVSLAAFKKTRIIAPVAGVLGLIGGGALLAHYSRNDEREADALGMEYMLKAGHNPTGMVKLMEILKMISGEKPGLIDMMFASHPLSSERYETAKKSAEKIANKNLPSNRERYMDNTAILRGIIKALQLMQAGEGNMARKQFSQAESNFDEALKLAPEDYAGLMMMTQCHIVQENLDKARTYVNQAKAVNPAEASASHLSGIVYMMENKFSAAYEEFDDFERKVPGNANTIFLKGTALEGMQDKDGAAAEYRRYLKITRKGDAVAHIQERFLDWGIDFPNKSNLLSVPYK